MGTQAATSLSPHSLIGNHGGKPTDAAHTVMTLDANTYVNAIKTAAKRCNPVPPRKRLAAMDTPIKVSTKIAAALAVRLCNVNSMLAVSAPLFCTSRMYSFKVGVGIVATTSLRSAKSSMRMASVVSNRDMNRWCCRPFSR